jgi:hypothetical protein
MLATIQRLTAGWSGQNGLGEDFVLHREERSRLLESNSRNEARWF